MRINLDLAPLACPRPRVTARNGFAHAYYSANYKHWKEAAAKAIAKALPKGHIPYHRPVAVTVTFNAKRPKTTKLFAPKPDLDNYLKALLDAATTAALWTDDTLVVTSTQRKRWADADSIEIVVELEYL